MLIVCGLKREAAVFAGPGALSAYGVGPILQSKLDELADRPVTMVVSFGLCGGLDPALRCGDIVLGTEVVYEGESVVPDSALTLALKRRFVDGGQRCYVGRFAGAASPVLTRAEKYELRAATGAVAVDMESLAAGLFARARNVPFAILRAVCDPADRNLPPLARVAVDPDGSVNLGAVIGGLVRRPSQLRGLIGAATDSGAAIRALRRCSRLGWPFPDFLPHL
jgi:hopanoid-associated phosphorylase